ncbi:hypothetical protein [Pyxidicoccus sp. MSG2]|uniref:hypothetical protein n=1 Tax=Pyxidicoccus sp. MSG2 TaxID=2996790 RepID=UPI00226DD0B0|nr:hypothetical protein [Pyxidicoccus sp. MSG2]MCY1023883.1 hypothetical protein [Pyxidicoccus sp. MSG2]
MTPGNTPPAVDSGGEAPPPRRNRWCATTAWALRLGAVVVVTLLAYTSFMAYMLSCLVWPLLLVSFATTLYRRTARAALDFAVVVLCFAGLQGGFAYRHRQVEHEAAPVIAAVEDFQRAHGHYPKELSELPPSVWTALPNAAPNDLRWQGAGGAPCWYREPDERRKAYGITCVTFVFLKHTYDSERRRWYSWD